MQARTQSVMNVSDAGQEGGHPVRVCAKRLAHYEAVNTDTVFSSAHMSTRAERACITDNNVEYYR